MRHATSRTGLGERFVTSATWICCPLTSLASRRSRLRAPREFHKLGLLALDDTSALLQLVKLTVQQVITLLVPLELALDDIPLLGELAERDSTADSAHNYREPGRNVAPADPSHASAMPGVSPAADPG
jgi:hypothetical protein